MKEVYICPEMDVVTFEAEDIITSSGAESDDNNGEDP